MSVWLDLEIAMKLEKIDYSLTVCKVESELDIDLNKEFYFIGKTDCCIDIQHGLYSCEGRKF